MTDAVERVGAALVFGSMLLNVAWALGETIGAPAAASHLPGHERRRAVLLLAAAMLVTLGPVLMLRSLRPTLGRRRAVSSTGISRRRAGHVEQLLAERLVANLGHADARVGQHAQRVGRKADADGRSLAVRQRRRPSLRTSA